MNLASPKIQENAAPTIVLEGRAVICDECGGEYRIKQKRNDYRHKRRLCPSCRGAAGGRAHHEKRHTPESTPQERVRANGLINGRIKLGKIVRPGACQHCDKVGKTDAHHPDYSRPEVVVFLCRRCHMKSHADAAFEIAVAVKATSTGALQRRLTEMTAAGESVFTEPGSGITLVSPGPGLLLPSGKGAE